MHLLSIYLSISYVCNGMARARMFRDRYLLVQQRILRHEAFSAPVVRSSRKDYLRISTIESLLGTTGTLSLAWKLDRPKSVVMDDCAMP